MWQRPETTRRDPPTTVEPAPLHVKAVTARSQQKAAKLRDKPVPKEEEEEEEEEEECTSAIALHQRYYLTGQQYACKDITGMPTRYILRFLNIPPLKRSFQEKCMPTSQPRRGSNPMAHVVYIET